jgi:hypothetical protein
LDLRFVLVHFRLVVACILPCVSVSCATGEAVSRFLLVYASSSPSPASPPHSEDLPLPFSRRWILLLLPQLSRPSFYSSLAGPANVTPPSRSSPSFSAIPPPSPPAIPPALPLLLRSPPSSTYMKHRLWSLVAVAVLAGFGAALPLAPRDNNMCVFLFFLFFLFFLRSRQC